ncbi:MAG: hypothetical protein A2Y73_01235 [Chloroflexi bacterium RBG_13_56_8]|nr:MAG: hypothetical protein A2Y73_01235 [Chloroflexi bacterium RBG_13_56_8]
MTASLIVPVRNGERVIARCLQALGIQDLDRDYEVIVVDDGSTDGTRDTVLLFPHAHLICQPPQGAAAARNRGWAIAQGDIILFTDADCAPQSDWARQLITALERTGAAGARGVYATQQRSLVARFVQVEYETRYRRAADGESIDFVDTYSAAYRRQVLEEVGGFDERFLRDEDQELSFRVTERGHRLIFVPSAIVDHLHARTVWAYARKKFYTSFWKVPVLKKHPGKAVRDSHTPQWLKVQIVLAGLLALAALGALWLPNLLAVAGVLAVALFVSWLPFLSYAARRDPPTLLVAPFLLLVRAYALGLGMLWGMVKLALASPLEAPSRDAQRD